MSQRPSVPSRSRTKRPSSVSGDPEPATSPSSAGSGAPGPSGAGTPAAAEPTASATEAPAPPQRPAGSQRPPEPAATAAPEAATKDDEAPLPATVPPPRRKSGKPAKLTSGPTPQSGSGPAESPGVGKAPTTTGQGSAGAPAKAAPAARKASKAPRAASVPTKRQAEPGEGAAKPAAKVQPAKAPPQKAAKVQPAKAPPQKPAKLQPAKAPPEKPAKAPPEKPAKVQPARVQPARQAGAAGVGVRKDVPPPQIVPPRQPATGPAAVMAAPIKSGPARTATIAAPPTTVGEAEKLRSLGGRWLLPIGLAAAVLLIAIAVILFSRSPRTTTGPAADPVAAQAVQWLGANLPTGSQVLTDDVVLGQLRSRGVTRLHLTSVQDPTASLVPTSYDYVVSTPLLRAAKDATGRSAQAVLAASEPVATFRSGSDALQVLQVSPLSQAERAVRVAADRSARALAISGLTSNRRLSFAGTTARTLRERSLDLRAATFLAVLSDTADVTVADLPLDAAEQSADLPPRAIRLRAVPGSAVAGATQSLAGAYRPMSVTTVAGTTTISWSPAVAPVQSAE